MHSVLLQQNTEISKFSLRDLNWNKYKNTFKGLQQKKIGIIKGSFYVNDVTRLTNGLCKFCFIIGPSKDSDPRLINSLPLSSS